MDYGRIVGGFQTGSTIHSGRDGLSVPHPRNPFKRVKLDATTVAEWEELSAKQGVVGMVGQAAAKAGLPGKLGKAIGAGLGAASKVTHTIRLNWVDGNQSVIELPDSLFTIFAVLLDGHRVGAEAARPEPLPETPGVTDRILDLASSVINRGKPETPAPAPATIPAPAAPALPAPAAQADIVDQLMKLASLRDAGILTEEEFAQKKAQLLERL